MLATATAHTHHDLRSLFSLDDATLTADICHAHARLTHFKARFIIASAEFDDRGLARALGAASTVVWLQREFGVSRSTGFEYLAIGRKLRMFPLLSSAFLAAEVSYSTVRLLLRYLTTDNEVELVDLAMAHPYAELSRLLAGRDRPDAPPSINKINVVVDPETGDVRFWGRLDPERGAELLAALKISELANLTDLAGIDEDTLNDPEKVNELIDEAREPDPEPEPEPPLESAAADSSEDCGVDKQATNTRFGPVLKNNLFTAFMGLVHMVRSHPVSRVQAPGAEVNVLVTQDNRAYLPGQHGGQTGQLLRLILNGAVRFHLLSRDGLTLKTTRATRLATTTQTRALLTAWGHQCAAPGCDHMRFLEFHHLVPWVDGGATELSNLIPLCSGCHALVTAGVMTIHVDTDPSFLRFRLPGGDSFTSENRGPAMVNAALGRWGDHYFDGPVPAGDEGLLQVWEQADSFADPGGDPAPSEEDQSMR